MSQKSGTPTYSRGGQNRGWTRKTEGAGEMRGESRVEKTFQEVMAEKLLKNIHLHM